jgi:hypothetical protein
MRNAIEGAGKYPVEAYANQAGMAQARKPDITIRENIDRQIEAAEDRVKLLQETKARLESSGLLDTRIEDLEVSMRW